MKKTLVRLKVRREVIRTLTRRDLTLAAGGDTPNSGNGGTKIDGGCQLAIVKPVSPV